MKMPRIMLVLLSFLIGHGVVFAQDVDLVRPKNPRFKKPPVKIFIPKVVVPEVQPAEFVCPTPSNGSVYPRVVFRLEHQVRIPSGQTGASDIVYTVPTTCILVIETVFVFEASGLSDWVQFGLGISGAQPSERFNMVIPIDRTDTLPGQYSNLKHTSLRYFRAYALPGNQVSLSVTHYPNAISAGPNFTIHGYLLHHESPSIGP